jgi:transcriptional regulator with GAF, ATPase, and Fis domain
MRQSSFFHRMLETGRLLSEEVDSTRRLNTVLDFAIESAGANRGAIIIFNENEDGYFELWRNSYKENIDRHIYGIKEIFGTINGDKKYVNYFENKKLFFQVHKRLREKLGISSLLLFPLIRNDKICGFLYLDRHQKAQNFDEEIIACLQNFSDFISLEILVFIYQPSPPSFTPSQENKLRKNADFDYIIGSHPKLLDVLQVVTQVASTDVPVLIEGETGTGKELIARAIHFNSQRQKKQMISVNCGAFPENLLESEFFGYRKGAFTGAIRDHRGKFELANGGTIFLDEVDEMSPLLQVKLLRILQWGEFSPLGSNEVRRVDVRIVAASKTPLKQMVEEGKFRPDLYYRLNLMCLELPPLRERREDILQLAYHFLNKRHSGYTNRVKIISPEAQKAIQFYNYPGNVRELENIIQRAAILCKDNVIQLTDLPPEVQNFRGIPDIGLTEYPEPFKEAKRKIVAKFEKTYLRKMLDDCDGVIAKAAKKAGMHEKNFREKLRAYNIHT